MCTDVLILAGGSGERLWPVSNYDCPKQFMALSDGETFLQSALRRAASLDISGNICIVTRKNWTNLVIKDVLDLAECMNDSSILSKVLIMSEPFGKNTAPAIAWTSRYLLSLKRNEPVTILMMASDHIINPIDSFISDVKTASYFAEKEHLVSFSIPPVTPSTGYGYIKTGEQLPAPSESKATAWKVEKFREKPDAETAKAWLKDGHYFWNSGIYAFRADFFLSELAIHAPEVFASFPLAPEHVLIETIEGVRVMKEYPGLEKSYTNTPSISIDYALSEKCDQSVTVQSTFLWDDVGTWDSLATYTGTLQENIASIESNNCFVQSDIPVALCGVDDLVVVIKDGKALVAKKGETNLVKDALAELKEKGLA